MVVVLGAAADRARALLPAEALPVVADGWQAGMGASLHEGLRAVAALDPAPDAVVVCLVDTPGVSSDAVARLVPDAGPSSLAQATYGGRRGHPVLLGRDHWDGVRSVAVGDRGARDYLARHPVHLVECGDVADGYDVDTAEQARTVGARWAAGQRPPLSD